MCIYLQYVPLSLLSICICFEYSHLVLCHQCVDLSCNELNEITLPENLPPKLQELDLTGNPRLNLDHKTLEQLKYVIISHKNV